MIVLRNKGTIWVFGMTGRPIKRWRDLLLSYVWWMYVSEKDAGN